MGTHMGYHAPLSLSDVETCPVDTRRSIHLEDPWWWQLRGNRNHGLEIQDYSVRGTLMWFEPSLNIALSSCFRSPVRNRCLQWAAIEIWMGERLMSSTLLLPTHRLVWREHRARHLKCSRVDEPELHYNHVNFKLWGVSCSEGCHLGSLGVGR